MQQPPDPTPFVVFSRAGRRPAARKAWLMVAGIATAPLMALADDAAGGAEIEASLTGMVQRAQRSALEDVNAQRSRANFRGDITATLPAGEFGASKGTAFVHARFGQGEGLALRPMFTGTANSTSFGEGGLTGTLAQAWYQLELPWGERKALLTVGKIDPFVFFDQNAIADDETRRFVNNAFVHNPLLDSGGDVGANGYGFSPGVVAAWEDASNKAQPWGASLGVFGSGNGESFRSHGGKRFAIAQAWWSPSLYGQPGTYRAYVWTNPRGSQADGSEARHSGWGMSIDQGVSSNLTLFGRYGHQTAGSVRFGRALTMGGEMSGAAWGRQSHALGLALGLLRTGASLAAGPAVQGSGSERVGELYYRIGLGDHVEITPHLQVVARPAGSADSRRIALVGLRARVGF